MARVLLHGYHLLRERPVRWQLVTDFASFFVGVRLDHHEGNDYSSAQSYTLHLNVLPVLSLRVQWYPEWEKS